MSARPYSLCGSKAYHEILPCALNLNLRERSVGQQQLHRSESAYTKLCIARAGALDIKSLTTRSETAVLLGTALQETTAEVSQYLEIGGRGRRLSRLDRRPSGLWRSCTALRRGHAFPNGVDMTVNLPKSQQALSECKS